MSGHLYKYINWENEYHKKILIENEIYFSSPKKFNDPYDCRIPLRFDLGSREQLLEFGRELYLHKGLDITDPIVELRLTRTVEAMLADPDNYFRTLYDKMFNKWKNDFGVFSLTEHADNIIMWSHYANKHKGIVIGFDRKLIKDYRKNAELIKNKLIYDMFKVQYVMEFPQINPFDYGNNDDIILALRIKSKSWKYEDEIRLILISGTNKPLNLPGEIIKEVYFGVNIEQNSKDEIISHLKKRSNKVDLFQYQLSRKEFKLEPISVDYK